MHSDKNNQQGGDALSDLWQTQPTNTIDVSEVKKSFNSERVKQRFYILIDLILLLPPFYLMYLAWGEMTFAARALCAFMVVTALPLLMYQLWLRRVAAFTKDSHTLDHLKQFTHQIKNNIRIAFITKHSAWPAFIILPLFVLERHLAGVLTPEKWETIMIALPVASVIIIVWGVWAQRRQKRFEKQLAALQSMADDAANRH